MCSLVAEEAGLNLEKLLECIRFVPDRPGHDRRYAMNPKRIRKHLGWYPKVPFESGLRLTVRWYLENQDWIQRVISGEYRTYYEAVYSHAWGQASA